MLDSYGNAYIRRYLFFFVQKRNGGRRRRLSFDCVTLFLSSSLWEIKWKISIVRDSICAITFLYCQCPDWIAPPSFSKSFTDREKERASVCKWGNKGNLPARRVITFFSSYSVQIAVRKGFDHHPLITVKSSGIKKTFGTYRMTTCRWEDRKVGRGWLRGSGRIVIGCTCKCAGGCSTSSRNRSPIQHKPGHV